MTNRQDSHAYQASTPRIPIRRLILIIWLCWSTFLLFSLFWNIKNENRAIIRQATCEAEGHFNKDVVYRRWSALQGGVYVPASDYTPPSPYLEHVSERDITTPSGRRLTLVNPAYMTRQVMELAEKQYGVRGHITSLKAIRPKNTPDDWEQQALKTFELGTQNYTSVEEFEGKPYLRFMRPFITEQGCLKCHAVQGYTLGDIRGGVSVSVPLDKYYNLRKANVMTLSIWHLMTYLLGTALIVYGGKNLTRSVTERELAFNELQSNQARFKSLLALSQMSAVDDKTLVDFALDEAISLSGSKIGYVHYYDEENQLLNLFHWDKLTLKDCKIPDLSEEYPLEKSGVWTDCIRQGKPVIHNDYVNMPDKKGLPEGHFPILRHMSIPIIDGKKVIGLIGVGNKAMPYTENDVTQVSLYANSVWEIIKNKRAEEQLLKRECELKRFRALIEQANDAIFIISSEDGDILDTNERACKNLGYERHELLNLKIQDISGAENWQEQINKIRASGDLLFEGSHQRKDGTRFTVEVNAKSITFDDQDFVVAAARDITDRKTVEAELEQHRHNLEGLVEERTLVIKEKTKELEKSQQYLQRLLVNISDAKEELELANVKLKELDKLKSMFIASMSHELRTPLNAIIGFSSLVLNGMTGEINEQQRDQLERVYRSGKHLLGLITDIIDISKIESGRVHPYLTDFPLAEVINEACDSLKLQIAEKQLSLIKKNADISLGLHTDRKRLLQCLLNYLSNAVKFTEQGQIELSVEADPETVTICVADSGIGISEKDLPSLFQSFVRLDSPLKITIPGTGLGLYLTKKLAIEVLGGEVWAESTENQGSRFYLKIPQRISG